MLEIIGLRQLVEALADSSSLVVFELKNFNDDEVRQMKDIKNAIAMVFARAKSGDFDNAEMGLSNIENKLSVEFSTEFRSKLRAIVRHLREKIRRMRADELEAVKDDFEKLFNLVFELLEIILKLTKNSDNSPRVG